MKNLQEVLAQLGGLHDARMSAIRWDADLNDLEFAFTDMYANFRGLPDYPGAKPGAIVLHQVKALVFALEMDGHARVFDFSVEEMNGEFLATVLFSPSGTIKARFLSADYQ